MKTGVLTNTCLIFAIFVTVALCNTENYRLPKNVKPLRYYLTIQPNLENETFNGSVVIDIIALENSNNITLHKKTLKINNTSISVLSTDGGEIGVVNTTQDKTEQTYTITTKNQLIKDRKYHLVIGNFNGFLKQKLVGFYVSSYYDNEGNERKFALTDFEPLDARRAFPCFDEPALKAKFIINLIRRSEYKSVSNEELESTVDLGNDLHQDIYKETIDMSTYLVAFAVFDFDSVNSSKTSKIYGRPQAIKDNAFSYAVEYSEKILQAMENFTGIHYNLNKIDQIAVPEGGFASGAMENWGLVTYREQTLAFTNSSTSYDIQYNLGTIAHEFSHQWFGNLVSPRWWDSIWLNEAFATYFRYYLVDVIHPSWGYIDTFVNLLHDIFVTDSKFTCENNKVGNNFLQYRMGGISILYRKGAVVVRMMDHFLTHDIFKAGLRIHLNRHKFGSAQTEDLYDALQTAVNDANATHLLANLTVAEVLDTWVNRSGFPIVTVTRNYTTGSITFTQKKREGDCNDNIEDEKLELFHIPINYAFESDPPEKMLKTTADFWLSGSNKTLDNLTTSGWILVNIQQTGLYRVNYDIQNWERIIDFMRYGDFEAIPSANRAQLINDAFNLAKSKEIPYSIAFKLCEYLVRERDYIPISAFIESELLIREYFENLFIRHKHNEINDFWDYTVTYTEPEEFITREVTQAYFVHILRGVYTEFGIMERRRDSNLDNILRARVLSEICLFLDDCREDLRSEFTKLRTYGIDVVKPNLQRLVLCEGAKTESGKNFLLRLYKQTSDIFVRERIKSALDCYLSHKSH